MSCKHYVHVVGEEIHVVHEKQCPSNSRNAGNKRALTSLSMGLVVINNNQFIRFNLE